MVRCWKHSENRLEEEQCTDGGPAASPESRFPHKAFWISLSASLLLVVIALGLTGRLGLSQPHSQSLQIVRIAVPDQTGVLINQSAVVDQQNDLVTFSVTSPANQTSTVLFDIKHGLICYKPVEQGSCFLQKMEQSDYDNVHSLLNDSTHKRGKRSVQGLQESMESPSLASTAEFLSTSDPSSPHSVPWIFLQEATAASPSLERGTMATLCEEKWMLRDPLKHNSTLKWFTIGAIGGQSHFQLPGNETQRQTEFLGVLAASQVDASMLQEPLQALCQDRSVHWTRRARGPGKQRLVYFCIDICFPSNICVSVCFYYLPE